MNHSASYASVESLFDFYVAFFLNYDVIFIGDAEKIGYIMNTSTSGYTAGCGSDPMKFIAY